MLRHATVLCAVTAVATAQAPPTYYASVNTTSQALLRSTLHAVIDDHTRLPYTASTTDTWDVLEVADQNPANTGQILDLYRNQAFSKVGGGNTNYDREHTWPKSYGFPDEPNSYPHNDCHHLFLCAISYNGARANKPFGSGTASWTEWVTVANGGQGGGSGTFPGNSNWTESSTSLGAWQVWNGRKGDVARALFYMDVRYEGGNHGITNLPEPDLVLTDNLTLIANSSTTTNTTGTAYMGKLATLLQWHTQDPVDAREQARNNAVFAAQGNRNPFIDHPEWVACLFSGQCATKPDFDLWINELHYDNNGVDTDELVEVAGTANARLDGWTLVAYNGTDGKAYATVALRGTVTNQQNGLGTRSFAMPGLQNGSPDGIALVAPSGRVWQFLAYEGAFTAVDGPAAGRTAVDIGVAETATSTPGTSLQLVGSGFGYGMFTWQAGVTATPGLPNAGQTLQ